MLIVLVSTMVVIKVLVRHYQTCDEQLLKCSVLKFILQFWWVNPRKFPVKWQWSITTVSVGLKDSIQMWQSFGCSDAGGLGTLNL